MPSQSELSFRAERAARDKIKRGDCSQVPLVLEMVRESNRVFHLYQMCMFGKDEFDYAVNERQAEEILREQCKRAK